MDEIFEELLDTALDFFDRDGRSRRPGRLRRFFGAQRRRLTHRLTRGRRRTPSSRDGGGDDG
ncbi:hypothetical protein [Tsukamurella tyrosinosolvens]|uniref:hypothetical protein n=1 Tax=Tsukamurella tyrosinosolvens TaxID=57704 RepID=UPI000A62F704|nr:hypothetical protein [Tsukamurella tyrosinosolvens]